MSSSSPFSAPPSPSRARVTSAATMDRVCGASRVMQRRRGQHRDGLAVHAEAFYLKQVCKWRFDIFGSIQRGRKAAEDV